MKTSHSLSSLAVSIVISFFGLCLTSTSLTSCSAGGSTAASDKPSPSIITLTGTLTMRGAQIEAWWAVRAENGKLWRLDPANVEIKKQFMKWNNQTVRLQIDQTPTSESSGMPTLRVSKVELLTKDK